MNRGSDRVRLGAYQRVQAGPACVKRVGHAGIHVSDFRRSAEWYQSRFGFIASDEVFLGDRDNLVAAFLRCDLGDVHADHHTLVCVGVGDQQGLDHVAFEVEDYDAVMLGTSTSPTETFWMPSTRPSATTPARPWAASGAPWLSRGELRWDSTRATTRTFPG